MRCIVDSFRATVRARTSLWALLALPLLLLLGCQHGETPTEARGVPSYSEHSSSDHRFVSASAGVFHTCGVTAGSRAFCWGRNDQGQLGDGTTSQRLTPVAVSGDHRFASVSAGGPHTCGITANGQAFCWGRNQKGELSQSLGTTGSPPSARAGRTRALDRMERKFRPAASPSAARRSAGAVTSLANWATAHVSNVSVRLSSPGVATGSFR
jgi:hypothetical protein